MNENTFGRADRPVEDYNEDLLNIKTFEQLKEFERKYSLILDDAAPQMAAITAETFPDFISELPKCFDGEMPDDKWMSRYGTIPVPTLLMQLMTYTMQSGMCSGFEMNRLLDENKAEIRNGKYFIFD